MTNARSFTAIGVGLAVTATIALAGSSNAWSHYTLPPMMLAALVAVLIQWLGFLFAWRTHSERFFDLVGSTTFVLTILVAVVMSRTNLGALDMALAVAVVVWALRLGVFLTSRVRSVGSDQRFDVMKWHFGWFLMTWTLQGVWVVVTASAALTVIGDGETHSLNAVEYCGLLVWFVGLCIEVVADDQKRRFRKKEPSSFMSTGLWSRSRHPNYFGEILLWSGLALAVLPSLRGWGFVTLTSPFFVWLLVMKISGAPMLEAKADKRWHDDPQYRVYKERTPLLIPRVW
jgi:steroid 5-alpha reductase family enzyme